MIGATLLGPILAVQAQKVLERIRQSRNNKEHVFQTLMATRANRLSVEHVRALNLIDIEFNNRSGLFNDSKKYRHVIDAWKNYSDHLFTKQQANTNWMEKNDDLFIEVLYQMSIALGYEYDKVVIRRRGYVPQGHGDQENQEQIIREGMANVMSGHAAFPIYVVNNQIEADGDETAV